MRRGTGRVVLGALALGLALSSCAYYNTFYLARKYYDVAALRQPYLVDKPQTVDTQNFNKSIEYSKKVLSQYPKSKWVDDAYLLWARGLLGKEDPVEVVNMLQDFETRYPKSPIHAEATFYLGVAYRHAHKYAASARTLDDFLAKAPKHDLAPYAYLERARALISLEQYADAAASAGKVLERWPKSKLEPMALAARAEADFKAGEYDKARQDFRELGFNARDDDERLAYLLREADCLEAGQAYDEEMALLKGAQSHEVPPPPQPEPVIGTGSGPQSGPMVVQSAPPQGAQAPGSDRYGQLMVRIGTVALLQGQLQEAVSSYHSVVRDYPHTPLAAEAQYRIGYAYETVGDDFDKARAEYGRVRDIANSAFVAQAASRLENLDRLSKFRSTTKDTVETKAETAFLLAEQYLFQVNKPDRALDQYRKIEQDFAGTKWSAKAIVAQAWVLSRKLGRKAEADSLFWLAVRDHPATEAQLAARDYLEMEGAEVPDTLIKLPQVPTQQLATADSVSLTPVPQGSTPLGAARAQNGASDSLGVRPPGGALGAAALGAGALMYAPDSTLVGPVPPPGTAASPQSTAAPPTAVDPPAVTGPPMPGPAAAAGAGAATVGAPAVTGPPAPGPAAGASTAHAAAGRDSTAVAPPDSSATHPSAPPDTSAHRKP